MAFLFALEIWVKSSNLLVYGLCLFIISFVYVALQRLKIVQSSNENSDVDSPQKAPFNEERR